MTFLRFIILLALAVWIGSLVFFPVVAQTSFTVLPSTHLAGLVVRNCLIALHWMGIVAGIIFLVCSMIDNRVTVGRPRMFALSHIFIGAMLALTAISQFWIIPRMDVLRITAGELSLLPAGNPIRAQFDSLHAWSTRIEMGVLVLGFLALYSLPRRFSTSRA
jgi:general stress protein CsbA